MFISRLPKILYIDQQQFWYCPSRFLIAQVFFLCENPQVQRTKNMPSAYEHNDHTPMVDKAVDATWPKLMQADKLALLKGT